MELNIIKEIKKGGQKKVYLAEYNGEKVIYKTGKCNSTNSLKRIVREVNILREIDSKSFPKNYFFECNEAEGTFAIIEEYIDGLTLDKCFEKYTNEKDIARLILDVIEGMKLLWKKEIVHRDLKPENIIISQNNKKPVIIDLGIAKSLLEESLTKTVMPIGPCTIPYASPEQLLNQKNIISPRSDFFALGIIAIELYCKHNPFDPTWVGNGLGIRDNIINGIKRIDTRNTKESEKFVNIFLKSLEVQPFNRYRKYTSFEDVLKEFLLEGELNE